MEIRYTHLFSLPEYRYFVCIRSSSLLLNIFRTFCFQWQLCWYWMYWHQMTESVELHSTYPNKNIQSLIFSQFWWVFRNSRFFLIYHVVIYCTYCVYGCTVTWGQQPGKFLSITEPRSISRKKPGCSLLGEPKLNKCWCFPSQVTFKCQRPIKKITLLFYARKGI